MKTNVTVNIPEANFVIYTPDRSRRIFVTSSRDVYAIASKWIPRKDSRTCVVVHDMTTQETFAWHRTPEGYLEREEL